MLLGLAYWPGGNSHWSSEPEYRYRIPVINTYGPLKNLRPAIHEWNACPGGPQLYLAPGMEPYTPKSITIFRDPPGGQEPAYGGWTGDYGIVGLGGGWTEARGVIGHEVGHALGFGHGGPGIMGPSGYEHVTSTDCKGLRNYYAS